MSPVIKKKVVFSNPGHMVRTYGSSLSGLLDVRLNHIGSHYTHGYTKRIHLKHTDLERLIEFGVFTVRLLKTPVFFFGTPIHE